jgi:hypothetical protein
MKRQPGGYIMMYEFGLLHQDLGSKETFQYNLFLLNNSYN